MRTNCLIFAVVLWFRAHGRGFLSVRRSTSFLGKIPHFVFSTETSKTLVMREVIPRNRKQQKTDPGESYLLFPPRYKIKVFQRVAEFVGDDYAEVESAYKRYQNSPLEW
jgi:hypothetical protein